MPETPDMKEPARKPAPTIPPLKQINNRFVSSFAIFSWKPAAWLRHSYAAPAAI
jgi:hypothetical protein